MFSQPDDLLTKEDTVRMTFKGIAKIFIGFVLIIIYVILFGLASLQRLQDGDITITRNDEFLENITSPGT